MPCDTLKVIEDEEPIATENQPKQEGKKMSTTLISQGMSTHLRKSLLLILKKSMRILLD